MGRRKLITMFISMAAAGSLVLPITTVGAVDKVQVTDAGIQSGGSRDLSPNLIQNQDQEQEQVQDPVTTGEESDGDAGQDQDNEVTVTINGGGTVGYSSIAEAVAAVNKTDGDALIEVQRDIDLTSGMEFTGFGTITITGQEKYTIKKTGYTGSAISGKTVVLNNIIIDGNNEKGGGVRMEEGGSLTLDNAEILNNRLVKEGKNGGAVYAPGGEVTVKNGSVIKGNVIAGSGGAIFAKTVYVEDSTIADNVAGEGNTLANSVYGGAIYAEKITVTTTDGKETNITGNIAKGGRGGAIAMDSKEGEMVIDGNTLISDNSTEVDKQDSFTAGGAIFIKNGNATIKGDTQIIKNTARGDKGYGGAIAIGKNTEGDLNIEGNVLITENHAENTGGAIRLNTGESKVYVKDGVQITGNTAPLGKNIYIEESEKRAERLCMSGDLTNEAIIGVRVANDGPDEGIVFGKTDPSFTGEIAITADRNGAFSAKKDDKGNLYWHNSDIRKVTYLDRETGEEKTLKVENGEKINIEPSGGKYNMVAGNRVVTVTGDMTISEAQADGKIFTGWTLETGEGDGYGYVLAAQYSDAFIGGDEGETEPPSGDDNKSEDEGSDDDSDPETVQETTPSGEFENDDEKTSEVTSDDGKPEEASSSDVRENDTAFSVNLNPVTKTMFSSYMVKSSALKGGAVLRGLSATNPEEKKIIEFTKIWNDNKNADLTRPAVLYVTLYQDGNAYRTVQVTGEQDADKWEYTFYDVPIYTDETNTTAHVYTVREQEPMYYDETDNVYNTGKVYDHINVTDNSEQDISDISGVIVPKDSTLENIEKYIPQSMTVGIDESKLTLKGDNIEFNSLGNEEYKIKRLIETGFSQNESDVVVFLDRTDNPIKSSDTPITLEGDQFSIRFKDAAYVKEGRADIITTISDIELYNPTGRNISKIRMTNDKGTVASLGFMFSDGENNLIPANGLGRTYNITTRIVESGTNNPIQGNVLISFKDFDIPDSTQRNGAVTNGDIGGVNAKYAEGVKIISGSVSPAYMPATSLLLTTGVKREENKENANGIRFCAPEKFFNDDETLNTGFITIMEASGFTVRHSASVHKALNVVNTNIIDEQRLINDTATITNTISPDIDPRANDRLIVSFIKTWDDKNNSGGTRPDSIPVTLYRNGEAYRTVNVTGYANADTWEFHFEDLPRYTDNTYTTEYEYSVKEGEVVGYQRSNGGEATYSKKGLIPYLNTTDNGIDDNCDTSGVVMVKSASSGVSHARYLPRGNVFLDRSKLSSSDIDPKITMNGVTRGEYSYKKEPSGINRYHPENPVPENTYIRDAAITWNSKGNTIPAHTEMDIPGTVTALYENAAQTVNGYADVQITYKKIHVNNPSPYSIKEIQIGDGSRFAPAFYSDDLPWDYAMYSSDGDHNAMQDFNPGIEMEVEIKVLEHGTAIPVDGKALLYVEDIDAPDYTVSNNSTNLIIASDYSESLKVVNGALTPLIMQGNAYWVNNFAKKGLQGSSSDGTGNGIRIAGVGQTDNKGFRSGFATLVDTKSTILNYTGSFHFSNEDMKIKPYLPFIGEEVFNADRSFITNSYIPIYVQEKGNTLTLRFTKTWDDANNVAGERPASIPVTLYRDGQPYRTVDVTGDPKADTWVYDFVDLPLYTDDTKTTEYQYRVNEGEIENYSVSQIDSDGYGQYRVRNRFPYEYVSDNALEDTNDVVGIISPKNRRIYGVENDDSVFRNFPEKHDVSIDKDKLMSVNADPKITTSGVSRGSYSFKVQGYGLDRYNPTNPIENDTVERLNLSWSAGGNPIPAGADMDIPGTVTTVYENAAYTKNGYGDVQLTYKNIHVYNPSPYSIKEIHLGDGADFNPTFFSDDLPWDYAHYSSEGTDNAMSDFNPGIRMEVEIKVFEHGTKIPIDGRALLAVRDIDEPDYTKTKNGLPDQYSTDYRESLQIVNGALTPLYVESVGHFSKKGILGDNIRGESVDGTGSGLTLLATRNRNPDFTFYQGYLSVFDTKGTTLKYTGSTRFSNDDLHTRAYMEYIKTHYNDGLQNFDDTYLTNTYIPEYARTQNFVTRTVQKIWNDQNNARGYRPESIDIILYRDGEVYRRATMTGDANAENWTYQFVDLPTYKDGTKEKSVYTVDEENVKNYILERKDSFAQYTLNREYEHVTDNGKRDESEILGVVIPKGTSATNIKNHSVPMANTSLRDGFGDEVEGLQISANGVYYGKYEVNEVPRGQDVYNPNTPIPEPTFTTKDLQWKATGTPIAAGSERDIPGTVTLLYENAAYTSEGLADVQITYSKVHVKNTSPYSINKIDFGNGEDIRLTFYSDDLPEDYGKGENSEYKDFNPGVTFEREVKILKHGTTNPVEGSVLLSVADLDNRDRTVTKLGMDASLGYGGEYAEQVGVVSGALSPMYIPGHTFQTEKNGIQGESKDGTANGLRAVAVVSYDNASLACGFLTLVDASGYTIRYAGSNDFSTEYKDNHCSVDFVSEQNVRQALSNLNNVLKPNYEEEGRLTEILFTKTWDDNNNEEGLRPESIDVILYQDGEIYRRATVTGDANADTWEYNFTSIPINKTGTQDEQHIYTIKEEDVSYYTPSDNGVADVNLGRNGFYTRIEDNDSDDLSDLSGVIIPDGTNESEVENKESILGYVPDGDVYFERDILGGRQGDGPQITATNVNHGKFNKGKYLSSEGGGYPNIVYWESTDDPIPAGAEMDISGEVTLLYEMAAYTPEGYADVQLTYKNIHVVNPSDYSISRIYFGDGEKMTIAFESDELSGDQNSKWHLSPGYKLDIEVKVLEHGTTNPVEGAVLLGFKDMDQKDQTVGRLGFNSGQYGMEYSEQIGVVSGALSPMYMPATTYQTMENGIQGESVDGNANGLTVVGVNNDVDTYRSGFIALMDASGYTIRYAGSNRFSNDVTRIPRRSDIAGYTERVSGSCALTNTVAPPVPTGLGVGKSDVAGRMIPIIIAACGGAGAFIFFEMRRRKRRRNAERKEA